MSGRTTTIPAFAILALVLAHGPAAVAEDGDRVHGNLILFNDNGAWCWFQDPRVIVDRDAGRIVLGSVADIEGVGAADREGDIDLSSFDLATGHRTRFTLHEHLISYGTGDDHNAPALWQRPDGRYLAMYAGHNNDHLSRFRISTDPHDPTGWRPEHHFDWEAHVPGGPNFPISYSNLAYLADDPGAPGDGRLYNFARGDNRSPNIMVSDDHGETWRYGGKVTLTPRGVGYVNGYPRYASDGRSRIHFIMTEHHPRDFNNSVYHGYIENGKSHRSDGTVVDDNIFDEDAPAPADFTPVFPADTEVGGTRMTRAWTVDIRLDGDGLPRAIFSTRADDSIEDHRFFYARYDGGEWHAHELGKAGPGIYEREEDYLGLGAIDPDDTATVYISTPHDPRLGHDAPRLDHYEIFRGTTPDGGASWEWTPITENSTADNLRPVVPEWDAEHTAVLWYRGTYIWQHEYDTAIVGIVERAGESAGPIARIGAIAENTTLADGVPLGDDDGWRRRPRPGDGDGTILTTGDDGPSRAPTLRTTVIVDKPGEYDVWALFWAEPGTDWRIGAGFTPDNPPDSIGTPGLFRRHAAQRVHAGDLADASVAVADGERHLHRAYVGRVTLGAGEEIHAYIAPQPDDRPDVTAGADRTWYDGIGYTPVTRSD